MVRVVRLGRAAAAALAILGALGAPAAQAARPATADEIAAIAPAVGLPASCISAQLSTIDATWATAQDTNVLPCSQADGTVILHLVSGAWTNVTAGSDFGFCPITGVPAAISTEFSLCTPVTAASYVLGAADFYPGGTGFGESKPKAIFDGLGPVDQITAVHWKHWGAATATATATGLVSAGATKQTLVKVGIRLRAIKRGRCDNVPSYQEVLVRAPTRHGGPLGPWTPLYGAKNICADLSRDASAAVAQEVADVVGEQHEAISGA